MDISTTDFKPDAIVCVLPWKMKNLSICWQMGEYAMEFYRKHPSARIYSNGIPFIPNEIPVTVTGSPEELLLRIRISPAKNVLVLIPALPPKGYVVRFIKQISKQLNTEGFYVTEHICPI